MIKTKNISEMLTSLIEEYRFNKNTLSKYLEITEETTRMCGFGHFLNELECSGTGAGICAPTIQGYGLCVAY